MAVYPPGDDSPPPPKDEWQLESRAGTDETLVQKPEPCEAQEKEEKKRRWPRWLCWGFAKKAPHGADKTSKTRKLRSIMGRFGSLFKKSEKEKPESNPYAQQPAAQSPAQSPPPPQYDQYTQYNNSQYNDNQSISQRPQGQPSGLPTGPRPGGLPGRVAPAPGFGNEKSPPPQYSPQPSQYSAYGGGSPSLGSAAGTPVLASNTSSPSVGTGFPREKYGASDGVGRNRFEPAPYGGSTAAAPQRQGGYGNLGDAGGGGLFDNYTPPSKNSYGPGSAQADGLGVSEQAYIDPSNMTAEEREDAEVRAIQGQINEERHGTEQSQDRSLQLALQAEERTAAIMNTLVRQGDTLLHANQQLEESSNQTANSHLNVKALEHATGSMFKSFYAKGHDAMIKDAELRQAQKAKKAQEEATRQRQQGFGRSQRGTPGAPQQTLGGTLSAEHRNKFVLEEADEEQEMRIEEKAERLTGILKNVRQNTEHIGEVLEEQNALIDKLGNKTSDVHDGLMVARNRLDRIR